jgi:hypothetical protein
MKSTYISLKCEEEFEIHTVNKKQRFTLNIYCDQCQTVHTFMLKPIKKRTKS